jgi:coatomer subunit beta
MLELLDASTSTVVYEAATSLTALTSNPVAVKAAAGKLIELAIREADNNVKLICLERVDQLRIRNEGVLGDLTMEALRVLSSPDIDVRRKALNLAMEMVSSKNVEEIIMLLKKELAKTVDEQYEQVSCVVTWNNSNADHSHRTASTAKSWCSQYTPAPSSSPKLLPVWLIS